MSKPNVSIPDIEAATHRVIAMGHRIFQPWRLAEVDQEHVEHILADLDPPRGATVMDVGCGIGEVAARMSGMRPDLKFILVNASRLQLDLCPRGPRFERVYADMNEPQLPTVANHCDCVMFQASLCQMDRDIALTKARICAKQDGGVLLINDMVRTSAIPEEMEDRLGLAVPSHMELLRAIERAGWEIDWFEYPGGSDAHFRELLAADGLEDFAKRVRHIVVRAKA